MSSEVEKLAEKAEHAAMLYSELAEREGTSSDREAAKGLMDAVVAANAAIAKDAERERKLVEALRSLRNECSGAVGIALPELHVALGNTNVACLKRRIEEADAALALFDQPVAPKETK